MIVILLYLHVKYFQMKELLSNITLQVGQKVCLKDPQSSDLGKKIMEHSIHMIDELGFESFTFKKLAKRLDTSEASIYRYFENKYNLLLYLTAWYWAWMEYRVVFHTANIECPEKRLEIAIQKLTEDIEEDSNFSHINETKLNKMVIAESPKAYFSKRVDEVNSKGAFVNYKQLVQRVSEIIIEINPDYKYPHMLVSSFIEGAHYQRFFADHLPKLTDVVKGEDAVTNFYLDMVFKSVLSENK